jgi:hypothetical protein
MTTPVDLECDQALVDNFDNVYRGAIHLLELGIVVLVSRQQTILVLSVHG